MKTKSIGILMLLATVFYASNYCLAADRPTNTIDKKNVLFTLKLYFDQAARAGIFSGSNRRQAEPYLIEILNDFASTNLTEATASPRKTEIFHNLLAWLSMPPNAEALIGINKILRGTHDESLRTGSLVFLEKLNMLTRRMEIPLDGGVDRLARHYRDASAA